MVYVIRLVGDVVSYGIDRIGKRGPVQFLTVRDREIIDEDAIGKDCISIIKRTAMPVIKLNLYGIANI